MICRFLTGKILFFLKKIIIPFQISKSALSTLESIHNAGILHGDIRRGNVLIGDFGITIIDFSHSEHSDNRKDKEKELSQLRDILGLAGKE